MVNDISGTMSFTLNEEADMGTFLVALILTAVVALAVRSMVRDKKKGKSLQCGGNCSSCGHCPHSSR